MQVHKTERSFAELEVIIDFITQDSFKRARKFSDELSKKDLALPPFPYKCRQSQKSEDENQRDLIFSGYIVPCLINKYQDRIEILGIFSENKWKL